MAKTLAPFGTWSSTIPASLVAAAGLRLGSVSVDGDDLYWLEGRPSEGGRVVLVRRDAAGRVSDVTPEGINARSRVHEYGGGEYLVADGVAYISNFADQRVYRIRTAAAGPDGAPAPGTPEPITPEGQWCYADYLLDRARHRLIAVREDQTGAGEPVNTLVALPLPDATRAGVVAAEGSADIRVLASGHDFVSSPRLSPDGARLAWLAWNHPHMPWDGTELWLAEIAPDGALHHARCVAGGGRDAIVHPGWLPDGSLLFVSDRDDWWRFYRLTPSALAATQAATPGASADAVPLMAHPPGRTEFGQPLWQLGWHPWRVWDAGTLVTTYTRDGLWGVARVDLASGRCDEVDCGVEPDYTLARAGARLAFVGTSTSRFPAVVLVDPRTGEVERVREASTLQLDPAGVSMPEPFEFPTSGGRTAHAIHYPPRNAAFEAPAGERPPLMVISHGGPTTATRALLTLAIQFWTSRGFALVDVNYGGSSGYGRAYRDRLNGQWGVVDVDDCVNAARYLVDQGKADVRRLTIRGGSAGGYTTLAALTFHPGVFAAGASYYGICDVEVLAHDTHKFESRYLDSLIGPYPEMRDIYKARSPINAVDRLASPLILLQGAEDRVVPPNQAQLMADALRAKGLPVALLMFEGEQHGFRKAPNIIRALEAELWFYGRVLGFTPADVIEPVEM